MATKKEKLAEKLDAIEQLKTMLKPGDTVYTILRRVSSSGMSRCISLHIGEVNQVHSITYLVSKALDDTLVEVNGSNAIRIGGAGMDMGFQLVYMLGRTLFPEGFKPRDAGKDYGRNGTSPDEVDDDGGYAFNHRWL